VNDKQLYMMLKNPAEKADAGAPVFYNCMCT